MRDGARPRGGAASCHAAGGAATATLRFPPERCMLAEGETLAPFVRELS